MNDPRTLRHLPSFIALLFLLAASAAFAEEKPKAEGAAAAHFVGSDTCKGCHEEQFKNIESTPHARLNDASDARYHGCESCHGAGSLHVEGGGDKTKIISCKGATGELASESCMACHQQQHERADFSRSAHARAGVGCVQCHAPHAAAGKPSLLISKQPGLCYGCHQDARADFSKPFHHKVNEGMVSCSDCHNPHGATADRQLRNTADGQEVCFKCHADKRGPFVFEHYPVKSEGCSTCHTPHGSTNPRLLTRSRVNTMCLECHQNFYNSPHPQNTKSQACAMCHVAIHGSNASEYFFR